MRKRKHPKFQPQGYGRKKRIKERWRRPRGIDSKMRIEKAYMGSVPKIGWRRPRKIRGLHPSGLVEILVRNPEDLKFASSNTIIRIASSVGKKKRSEIIRKAKEQGLRLIGGEN